MSEEITNGITDVLNIMDQVEAAEHPEGVEMDEWAFTNDKENPAIRKLFHMLYTSVFKNKVGLMHAKLRDGDEVHTVIVGVEVTPDGVVTWPIAKLLTEAEQANYVAPDGNGNWLE